MLVDYGSRRAGSCCFELVFRIHTVISIIFFDLLRLRLAKTETLDTFTELLPSVVLAWSLRILSTLHREATRPGRRVFIDDSGR